jgi:hypothetical protein
MSWSASIAAALYADIYQYCSGPIADPNAALYAAYAKAGSADFLDVTSGNDAFPGVSGSGYTAGPGYDNASGLGVPYGMPLAETLCPNRTPASAAR